jgi:hypothetical protein
MIVEKLLSLEYEVNIFGKTSMVTRRINDISVNIAYYYNNELTLIADNNIELLKQFIVDMDVKPFCYDLHVIRQFNHHDIISTASYVLP